MSTLTPLDTLYDMGRGANMPLPPELTSLYGPLQFPLHVDRPYVIANFVTTLDGVVSLNVPGQAGGGEISGFNAHDQMVMGLLRAVADAVIVGAGTLRAVPQHRWTPAYVYPTLAGEYQALRTSLGKPQPPLNVIVTAQGKLDLTLPVFQSGEVPVLIITTADGARRLPSQELPPSVRIADVPMSGWLSAEEILNAVQRVRSSPVILVEGGPLLMGDFLAAQCLDELFLTLAPQIAGRDGTPERPGFVAGRSFAPEHPLWGTLAGVKRGGNHLFMRYALASTA